MKLLTASPTQSIHQCVQNAALQLSLKITEKDWRGDTVSECDFFLFGWGFKLNDTVDIRK